MVDDVGASSAADVVPKIPIEDTIDSEIPAINTIDSESPAMDTIEAETTVINTIESESPAMDTINPEIPVVATAETIDIVATKVTRPTNVSDTGVIYGRAPTPGDGPRPPFPGTMHQWEAKSFPTVVQLKELADAITGINDDRGLRAWNETIRMMESFHAPFLRAPPTCAVHWVRLNLLAGLQHRAKLTTDISDASPLDLRALNAADFAQCRVTELEQFLLHLEHLKHPLCVRDTDVTVPGVFQVVLDGPTNLMPESEVDTPKKRRRQL